MRNITLVVQDGGGTLGLTLPVDQGFRFNLDRLIVMNTVLPIGEPLGPHYYEWRTLVRSTPDPPVGNGCEAAPRLSELEMAAYNAPYPDARHKAGPRAFPDLAMVEPQEEGVAEARATLRFWKEEWSGQSFMAIGANDPDVETMQQLQAAIRLPRADDPPDTGHFVQEESGQAVARAAFEAFGDI